MLKRYLVIVVFAISCLSASAYTKLTPEVSHFVSLHGDAGYSSLLHTIQGQKPALGMNTNFGLDYRLFYNSFVFSIGVEGMYELNVNQLDAIDDFIPMLDTEGQLFDMHVVVNKSSDICHMANVNVPILFGGEWKRFYFLVGPKLSYNLYGSTVSSALVTTYGGYDEYYDPFYDMPNHQFVSNQPMSSAQLPIKWNMNILAHVEVGARVGHMFKHQQFRLNPDKVRMYIGAYADFGLLNLHSSSGGAPIFDYLETDQGVQFFIQPLMLSSLADNATFRNLNVGVKFTIAFEMPKHGKSYIYNDKKATRDFRKRGGNQSIR